MHLRIYSLNLITSGRAHASLLSLIFSNAAWSTSSASIGSAAEWPGTSTPANTISCNDVESLSLFNKSAVFFLGSYLGYLADPSWILRVIHIIFWSTIIGTKFLFTVKTKWCWRSSCYLQVHTCAPQAAYQIFSNLLGLKTCSIASYLNKTKKWCSSYTLNRKKYVFIRK